MVTRILLVEDNPADARYVEEIVPFDSYKIDHASSMTEAKSCLAENSFDVLLLDLSLPDSTGVDTFLSVVSAAPSVPIIMLTGLNDDNVALKAMQLGAQDFILKQDLTESTLVRSIRYAIERKRAELLIRQSAERAEESETNLRLALKASHTGVWSWDVNLDKLVIDEQVSSILCVAQVFDTLENSLQRVHDDDRNRVIQLIYDAMDDGTDYEAEYRIVCPDGSIRHIAARGHFMYDDQDRPLRLSGICRDVTKDKLEEENFRRLLILEQHEDFIATLTHDLKNPLIGANRLFELLAQGVFGKLSEQQLQTVDLLKNSNSDMLSLIATLLEVYRYDAGATPLTIVAIDVEGLARDCIGRLEAIGQSSGVALQTNFSAGSHQIRADIVAMRRVLMNILGNGIKFTPHGGTVTTSGSQVGDTYVLEIKDTGPGVPEDDINALFQRFAQGRVGRTVESGTGLGLYLCRQIVEDHGGKISCISSTGQGTTFRIVLPCT